LLSPSSLPLSSSKPMLRIVAACRISKPFQRFFPSVRDALNPREREKEREGGQEREGENDFRDRKAWEGEKRGTKKAGKKAEARAHSLGEKKA